MLLVFIIIALLLSYLIISDENDDVKKDIRCPECNSKTKDNDENCPVCGTPLKINCGNCGKIIDVRWNYCPYCSKFLK